MNQYGYMNSSSQQGQSYGGAQGYYGNQNQGVQMGQGILGQYGSDPQMVRQHISQDLGYPGWQGTQGMMHGISNPQMIRQQIARDLGYSGYSSSMSGQSQNMMRGNDAPMQGQYPTQTMNPNSNYNQNAFQQVMQAASVPYVSQNSMSGQMIPPQQPNNAMPYRTSTFAEYGSNPQMVQQHIQSDLANGQGTMTSEQAGAYRHYGTNTFSQFGTPPQIVQNHIRQDMNHGSQMQNMPMGYGGGMNPMHTGASDAQWVRQQIAQDLRYYQ